MTIKSIFAGLGIAFLTVFAAFTLIFMYDVTISGIGNPYIVCPVGTIVTAMCIVGATVLKFVMEHEN